MSQHRVSAKKGKGKGGWWRVARRSHLQAGPCRGARSPSMVRNGRLCLISISSSNPDR